MRPRVLVGCATWAIASEYDDLLPPGRTRLARHAAAFPATEINSTFHRPVTPAEWRRWAAQTPNGFRFSVKLPKLVTHELRLRGPGPPLREFLASAQTLGPKLGPLLVQTPPSLAFDEQLVGGVLDELVADSHNVVWEPRHASWFVDEVESFLAERRVARVAADPAPVPRAAEPGGWDGLRYYRLHGTPRNTRYDAEFVAAVAERVRAEAVETWCIFDNTAYGHAVPNALELLALLR